VRIRERIAGPQSFPRDSEGDERFSKERVLFDELRDILKAYSIRRNIKTPTGGERKLGWQ
jgi:hypothetical protein